MGNEGRLSGGPARPGPNIDGLQAAVVRLAQRDGYDVRGERISDGIGGIMWLAGGCLLSVMRFALGGPRPGYTTGQLQLVVAKEEADEETREEELDRRRQTAASVPALEAMTREKHAPHPG